MMASSGPATVDAFSAVYFIFLVQGVGLLLPWNVFVMARNYFYRRFCGTEYDIIFEISIALGYNLSRFLALIWTLRYQDRYSIRGRIIGALTVLGLTFFLCCIFVLLEEMNISVLFVITMILVVISGICNAITDGAFFALATYFPPQYTQALMVGMSVSGFAMSSMAILTELAGPDEFFCTGSLGTGASPRTGRDEGSRRLRSTSAVSMSGDPDPLCPDYQTDWATFAYFAIGVTLTVVCLISYRILEKLPYLVVHMQRGEVETALPMIELSAVRTAYDRAWEARHESIDLSLGDPEVHVTGDASEESTVQLREKAPLSERESTVLRSDDPEVPVADDASEASTAQLLRKAPLSENESIDLSLDDPEVPVADDASEESTVQLLEKALLFEEDPTMANDTDVNGTMKMDTPVSDGVRDTWSSIAWYFCSVFFVYTVTLSLHPGITSLMLSSRECAPGRFRLFSRDIFTSFSFVSVTFFDSLGRVLSGVAKVIPDAWLPAASAARVVFAPLLLGCRLEHSRLPTLFPADGYMMAGSRYGPWAGSAMTTAILSGCMAGSLLSFPILYGVTGSFT